MAHLFVIMLSRMHQTVLDIGPFACFLFYGFNDRSNLHKIWPGSGDNRDLHRREFKIFSGNLLAGSAIFFINFSLITSIIKAVLVYKYLLHILRGSCMVLNNHSKPFLCIHSGALFTLPDTTSKLPPTPMIKRALNRCLYRSRKISFLGELMATNKMWGRDSAICWAITASSSSL